MAVQERQNVEVSVYDHKNNPLRDARVQLKASDEARSYEAKFDSNLGLYRASAIAPGRYTLSAAAPGFESDQREVQVDPAGLKATMILGPKGLPFLYRGEVKVPFDPPRDLIAVGLEPKTAKETLALLLRVAEELKLSQEKVEPHVTRQNIHVFRFPKNASDDQKVQIQSHLARVSGIRAVGPIVRMDKESFAFLANDLVVKFKSHVTIDDVPAIAKRFGLGVVRRFPQAGNAFLLRSAGPASYGILTTAARLVESGLVEYAEPDLIGTNVLDAINPTDFLYPMQWHLPLIHCPDAWQIISDDIDPNFTFGNPGLVIGVMDEGVDVTNPDFTGNVSSGATKVYQAFDFVNMVANNTSRSGGHGTCCAGISTALTNNPSVIAGQNEGVAGSAGNCRLLAMRFPGDGGAAESEFSDAYIWAAGFDPASTKAGFPAPISPGADVITNSFGASASIGMPISGLMKDSFNYLTTYGRGGRGVLLFFSAGNAGVDFSLQRPWAAYDRTFGVAASSLGTDGVTEVHAPYSNFAGATTTIDFCAPSDSTLGAAYNPPLSYGTVTATTNTPADFSGNAPSHAAVQTTTTAAAAAAATALQVASSAGFSVGQFLVVGAPGTAGAEFSQVTGIPNGTQISVPALHNAHPSGSIVSGGPNNSFNNFGGTSSATPLAAGVAALLISVRPNLTWIQVRDILRGTAVHIDAANTNATGIWTDQNGVASNMSGYLGPFYSRWYGFGRIDAGAAVAQAITLTATSDVLIRDNLGDNGTVPAVGRFWDSPDIWVRNLSPAAEGAAALPANYTTPGPTQDVAASHDNYIYARVKNIGSGPTSDFYVRIYLAHWPGTEFVYPANFIPTNHPGQPLPSPLTPGTYLIGEVHHSSLAVNTSDIVNVVWPTAAIPPETVTVMGSAVHWHPCLLVEISPHDGPTPSGNHVWDYSNIGQKNVTVNYAASNADFSSLIVTGNLLNESEFFDLVLDRSRLPQSVRLYVDVLNERARRKLLGIVQEAGNPKRCSPNEVVFLEETTVLIEHGGGGDVCCREMTVTLPARARLKICDTEESSPLVSSALSAGFHNGREVFFVGQDQLVRVPIVAGAGALVPIIVGGVADKAVKPGSYLIGITQVDPNGKVSGAAAVELRIKG